MIDLTTRPGRMLAAGGLTFTVTSARTGEHITLKADCTRKGTDGRWERVPFAEASHVFVNRDKRGQRVGTFYPRSGDFRPHAASTPALSWAAVQGLRWAMTGEAHPQAEFIEESACGKCGRKLTDPVSIERGIGPECWGALTDSIAYSSVADRKAMKAAPAAPPVATPASHPLAGRSEAVARSTSASAVLEASAPVATVESPEEQGRERTLDGTRKGSKASKSPASRSKAARIEERLALLPGQAETRCSCGRPADLFAHCAECDRGYATR